MQPEFTLSDPQRTCKLCGTSKPIALFPKGDTRCRICWNAIRRERYRADLEFRQSRIEVARQWRANNVERHRATAKANAARRSPEAKRASVYRWQQANIERHRLIQRTAKRVKKAIERGILVRPDICEECGNHGSRIEAAHGDYSKPLDVRWLCPSCHGIWDYHDPKTAKYDFVGRNVGHVSPPGATGSRHQR